MKLSKMTVVLGTALVAGITLAVVPVQADPTTATPAPVANGAGQRHRNWKNFKKKHPRRAQVLGRDAHQEKGINQAEANGKLTQSQANKLDSEDNAIRHQEQMQAAQNGGYITKSEQRADNQEMNGVRRQEMRDERKDAQGGAAAQPVTQTPPAAPAQ